MSCTTEEIFKGITTQEGVLEKFSDFKYRVPRFEEVTQRSLYPERVYPHQEYPKWTSKIMITTPLYDEVVAYQVRVPKGYPCHVMLELVANEYTAAKENLKLVECTFRTPMVGIEVAECMASLYLR